MRLRSGLLAVILCAAIGCGGGDEAPPARTPTPLDQSTTGRIDATVRFTGSPPAMNTLDMGVSLFLSGAVFAYLLSRQAATRAAERGWMMAAWAAMALAVLSKGLIGVVLPLGTLLAYALWHRQSGALARLHWLPGLALFGAITAPWFVLAARANPDFFEFFFLHEHFQRFTSTVHNRAGPIWYFLPILALAVGPWIVAAGVQSDGVTVVPTGSAALATVTVNVERLSSTIGSGVTTVPGTSETGRLAVV